MDKLTIWPFRLAGGFPGLVKFIIFPFLVTSSRTVRHRFSNCF